jgi:hypothetical protein
VIILPGRFRRPLNLIFIAMLVALAVAAVLPEPVQTPIFVVLAFVLSGVFVVYHLSRS